jgi:hypothetical protein
MHEFMHEFMHAFNRSIIHSCTDSLTRTCVDHLCTYPHRQQGYNSWYDLTCTQSMNETTLRATADKMVELGLPALGYKYLNLGSSLTPVLDM